MTDERSLDEAFLWRCLVLDTWRYSIETHIKPALFVNLVFFFFFRLCNCRIVISPAVILTLS